MLELHGAAAAAADGGGGGGGGGIVELHRAWASRQHCSFGGAACAISVVMSSLLNGLSVPACCAGIKKECIRSELSAKNDLDHPTLAWTPEYVLSYLQLFLLKMHRPRYEVFRT